jgi:hypothetical protein
VIVYLVEVEFNSYDNYYRIPLGTFDSLEVAQFNKDKWETFYKTKKEEIFSKYDSRDYRDEDGDVLEIYEDEYYENVSKFSDIYNYEGVYITNFELNSPCLPTSSNSEYMTMTDQWNTQWEREHKLNNILSK